MPELLDEELLLEPELELLELDPLELLELELEPLELELESLELKLELLPSQQRHPIVKYEVVSSWK